MPLNTPDFNSCDEKKCSTSGGVIFNCNDPCGGGGFDYTTGLCDDGLTFCDCNCHNDCPECYICVNGVCETDPACDKPFYHVMGYFFYFENYSGLAYANGTCDQAGGCISKCWDRYSLQVSFPGITGDGSDPGPGVVWVDGGEIGPFSAICSGDCGMPYGCEEESSVSLSVPRRSDGSQAIGPGQTLRTRFEGTYFSGSPNCGQESFKSGEYVEHIGYGDTAQEALQDVQSKFEARLNALGSEYDC